MAVETTTAKVEALGNGSATVFSFSPVVLPEASTDLEVRLRNNTTGEETLLAEGTSSTTYSVTVARYPGTGSLTYPASGGTPLTANYSIVMRRLLELEQNRAFPNQGGYFPEEVEAAFDRAMMVDIQQQEQLDRTPKFLPTADLTGFDVATIPMPEPDKVIAVNAAGTGFTLVAVPSASLVAAAEAAATNAEIAQAAAEAAAVLAEAAADAVPVPANPADDNKYLRANGGVYTLVSLSTGGDVVGPASAGSNSVPLYDGTTGKLLKAGVALGTSGHALISAGAGSPPAFGQMPTAGHADLSITEAKLAANAVGVTKLKREGTAGQILYSGGAGADPSWGAPPASSGETNTASNVGSGAGIWKDKNGVDLRFRSLVPGTVTLTRSGDVGNGRIAGLSSGTISFVQNANDVTLNLTLTYTNEPADGGS